MVVVVVVVVLLLSGSLSLRLIWLYLVVWRADTLERARLWLQFVDIIESSRREKIN